MRITKNLLALLLIAAVIIQPINFSSAQSQKEFYLESDINGKLVNIYVYAANAKDLYAFEACITFENENFTFERSASNIEGFSAKPAAEGEKIYYAFTKIGNVPGENGRLLLFTLSFSTRKEVRGEFYLDYVKTLDSKLVSTIHKADDKINVNTIDTKIGKSPVSSIVTSVTPSIAVTPTSTNCKPTSSSEVSQSPEKSKEVIEPVPDKGIPLGKPGFNDAEGHWAYAYIINLFNRGIIIGYDDGSIRPDKYITRAEAAVILSKALNSKKGVNDENTVFTDSYLIPSWSLPHVKALAESGVISGYDDGSFRAKDNITRAELVTMVIRALGQEPLSDPAKGFSDYESFPAWASGFIGKAVQLKIIKGYLDGSFKAANPIRRGEVFAIVSKSLDIFKTN